MGIKKGSISGKEEKKESPSEFMANQLLKALRTTNKLRSTKYNIAKWAQEFDQLIAKEGEKSAKEALKWFITNLSKNQYLNGICSAETFRVRFSQIKQAKDKSLPSEAEIGPLATKIAEELQQGMTWDHGEGLLLPAAVQKSINNYVPFYNKVWKLSQTKHINPPDTWVLADRTIQHERLSPYEDVFIKLWFYRAKNGLDEWRGHRTDQVRYMRYQHEGRCQRGRHPCKESA